MIDVRELGALQLDALREVANMGAGHAATALSQLTRQRISVDVPRIEVLRLEEVSELTGYGDEIVAGVVMHLLGDLAGRTIQILPSATAVRLAGILLQREDLAFPDGFGELEQSALKEAGNIIGGAYLNALSDFLGMVILTSVPGLAIDMASSVLLSSTVPVNAHSEYVFCIDTMFRLDIADEALPGHFLLLPDPASLEVILQAIRLI